MDVGGVGVGVRSKEVPFMPTMQISCFASSQTFRMNMGAKCSTRNWSSPLQQHRLMAGRAEIALKSHPLIVSKANTVLNNPPLMVGEAKSVSNDCIVMAADVETSSNSCALIARESKIELNHRPLVPGKGRIASNRSLPMAGEVKFGPNTFPLMAREQRIVSHRKNLMSRAVKVVSNGKEIGVRNAYKQVNYQQVRHIHDNHSPSRVSEEKCISVSEDMCFEAMVSGPGHTNSKGLRVGVVERKYSQQPNSMSSRWVGGQNSSQQSNSMSNRLQNGKASCNTAQMRGRNMSQNDVIQDFPSEAKIQKLCQGSKIPRTRQKSEENIDGVANWNKKTENNKVWSKKIQYYKEIKSRVHVLVPETQHKRNDKVNVLLSLKKQPESEDSSVEEQEREPQGTVKSDYIHSSSRPFEFTGKYKHDNREKGVREIKDNASQVSLSYEVTTEISESKGGNIEDRLQPESEDISVEELEREPQGTVKSDPIHSLSRPFESARKSKHDNRENGVRESKDNASQVSISDQVAIEINESKGGNIEDRLKDLSKRILIVDKVETAKEVVGKLMGEYKNLVHACDTEVSGINVKKESSVGHGKIICFSIYCGSNADFGDGKSCVWVDVLDGEKDVLSVFAPYFEDSSIRKVFHNYSFDRHIIENHGINVRGFFADTMHLARLWNSARREEGGYSLESLTKDPKVMDGIGVAGQDQMIEGKVSMKALFGKNKLKKDGTEGKTITVAPVEVLQQSETERETWICYSALDSMSTWKLWKSLQTKLKDTEWTFQGDSKQTMYDFYEEYWRPFGDLLVQMESKGMLVDRAYLSKMEEVAKQEQDKSAALFKSWASSYCSDAKYMNVGSDTQVRQLLFGGMSNKKNPSEHLPMKRTMKVTNVDNFIDEGKKAPSKLRNIELHGLGVTMEVEQYTVSGWPSVSSAALKTLAGKVSIDYENLAEEGEHEFAGDQDDGSVVLTSSGVKSGEKIVENKEEDISVYGTAYSAFGGGEPGRKACHAIAALCEVNSINTLISNFLLPLQGEEISGKDGRVHCSLNINTETGRLSARNPNLQNQPALEKDRYKIRQAFIASPGNSLIVADYGQLELRILAHLSNCRSMLHAFKAGGDFHSRTAMNMYAHVRDAVEKKNVLLEWDRQPGEEKPPIPLLKDVFASERRKAKMLNFSIAYGKTAIGLSKDWKVSLMEAKETVNLWYNERKEVLQWQEERKHEARIKQCVHTLLGRARHLPCTKSASFGQQGHIERAAINTPVQGSAADVAMCAMLEISRNARLKELGWTLVLQVHDEVILEGPTETAEEAKALVVKCMSYPFSGKNILQVDLAVDAKYAPNWYEGK